MCLFLTPLCWFWFRVEPDQIHLHLFLFKMRLNPDLCMEKMHTVFISILINNDLIGRYIKDDEAT
jgi:hypothetical protein